MAQRQAIAAELSVPDAYACGWFWGQTPWSAHGRWSKAVGKTTWPRRDPTSGSRVIAGSEIAVIRPTNESATFR
jgi:hypothetical protein